MGETRALERADLPAVARLLAAQLPSWNQDQSFLAQTLIDQRQATPELPSLVAVDGDALLGFIGVQARRIRFGERRVAAVCCSHLVVADDPRVGATGALLLRRLLSGDQDLTWTDTATDVVARMWRTFGGHVDQARQFDWMLVLRPSRWLGGLVSGRLRRAASAREMAPARAVPFQAVGRRLASSAFPSMPPGVTGEDATGSTIASNIDTLARDLSLWVDYDETYLDELLALIPAAESPPVCRLVRREGAPIGWYVYLPRPGGSTRVLHVCGLRAEMDSVFAELVEAAREGGTAVLTGRFEPVLRDPLIRRRAVLSFARCPLLHSSESEVLGLLATDRSLLTDLDGEWFAA